MHNVAVHIDEASQRDLNNPMVYVRLLIAVQLF